MDASTSYTAATSAWFSLQALPLLLYPRLIITLLSPTARDPTDLEIYFCRTLALTLIALALLALVSSGLISLSSSLSQDATPPSTGPTATATTALTTPFHIATAFYIYANYTTTGQTAFALGLLGSAGLACWGSGCLMFGGETRVRRSRWLVRGEKKRRS